MRGGVGPLAGRAGTSPWSDLPVSGRAKVPPRSALPLNRVLYIPFSIFAYSLNIVIASLVRIDSTLAEGTLKYSRFSLSSALPRRSCVGVSPNPIVQWSSQDRRDSYCAIATLLALTV